MHPRRPRPSRMTTDRRPCPRPKSVISLSSSSSNDDSGSHRSSSAVSSSASDQLQFNWSAVESHGDDDNGGDFSDVASDITQPVDDSGECASDDEATAEDPKDLRREVSLLPQQSRSPPQRQPEQPQPQPQPQPTSAEQDEDGMSDASSAVDLNADVSDDEMQAARSLRRLARVRREAALVYAYERATLNPDGFQYGTHFSKRTKQQLDRVRASLLGRQGGKPLRQMSRRERIAHLINRRLALSK